MVFRTEMRRQSRAQTAANDPYIWAVPELIVECLSPSNRKGPIQELLADYARIAVPEVWLLDPKPPQFTAYRYESGALRQCLATESGRVTPLLLPNVTVDLTELWAACQNGCGPLMVMKALRAPSKTQARCWWPGGRAILPAAGSQPALAA